MIHRSGALPPLTCAGDVPKRGANFTHAFVASPVCVPSRIGYFTGRYAHSHRNSVNDTLSPGKSDGKNHGSLG